MAEPIIRTNFRRQGAAHIVEGLQAFMTVLIENTSSEYYTAISAVFSGIHAMSFYFCRYWQIPSAQAVAQAFSISCHEGSELYFYGYQFSIGASCVEFGGVTDDHVAYIWIEPAIVSI